MARKSVSPRLTINLASSLASADMDVPSAGGVTVAFDYAASAAVTLPPGADVTVNKSRMKILFDLTARNLPAGASARILGVEFSKPNEPSGSYAPGGVFENSATFTDRQGAAHTIFGTWQQGKHHLKVIDDNPVSAGAAEQAYGYKVWVQVTDASGSVSYFDSPDPQIIDQPTT